MRNICFLLFLVAFKIQDCAAQTWEIELFGGASGYIGDINPVRVYQVTDPAYGIALKRNFDGAWSLSMNLIQGKIQGADVNSSSLYQRTRNLSFYSPITEWSLQIEFNFLNYWPGVRYVLDHHQITPFLFTGIGGVFFSPRTMYQGAEHQLQYYRTEGVDYLQAALAIPYGAGVKYNIKNHWTVLFKIGYRTAYTDYLDDVSGRYPFKFINSTALALSDRSGEINGQQFIGSAGTQRGDLRNYDTYMFIGVGISYNFWYPKCFFTPR